MSVESIPYLSPTEYLAFERSAATKSEYFNGEMFAVAGANEAHNTITGNIVSSLRTQLRGRPCRAYVNDMRVKVSDRSTEKYTYPDVVAVCGEREFEDDQRDTLLNPSVIIEVLSKSTEAYDRGAKFAHYRRIPSFQEYVLVSQTEPYAEHYRRQDDGGWLLTEVIDLGETILLTSIDCALALSEVYENTNISETHEASASGR